MKDRIRDFSIEKLMFGEGQIENDEQLFESGKIDSLGFMKLLAFIDKELNIQIDMSDVTMDKFATVNDIVKTIEGKSNA